MKLVVGLGNPEKKYSKSRHNVGFMVINRLASKLVLSPQADRKFKSFVYNQHESNTIFAKPQTSMNLSGVAVAKLTKFYKLETENVYIIHDDLDIRLGKYKIARGKGPKDHKGLLNIYQELGKEDFWHVRIGVDNREPDNRILGEEYVLGKFTDDEMLEINNVVEKVSDELISLVSR